MYAEYLKASGFRVAEAKTGFEAVAKARELKPDCILMDLSLPAQSSGGAEQLKENNLKLEVVIRPDAIEVGDRIGGLIERIPNTDKGYDLKALSSIIQMLKGKFPNQTDATVLAQPNTSYDVLVQVMDAVRESQVVQGPKVTRTELFPDISIGDAPISQGGKP